MITHVPGPFERLIRRLRARIAEWMDGLLMPQEAAVAVAPEVKRQTEAPASNVAPVRHKARVAHSAKTGNEPASLPRNSAADRKAAHARERDLLNKIARAIEDGRAKGSQREISRTFNVSRATVQRAQRLVREAA